MQDGLSESMKGIVILESITNITSIVISSYNSNAPLFSLANPNPGMDEGKQKQKY
jgi:hypothetical protein